MWWGEFVSKMFHWEAKLKQATTEVSFGNSEQGTLQVIIIPTTKLLIAKKNPSLKDVGSATGILNAISPAITGRLVALYGRLLKHLIIPNSVAIEEEDIVDVKEVEKQGKVYYEVRLWRCIWYSFLLRLQYELFTPYAQSGAHNLTTVCTSMVRCKTFAWKGHNFVVELSRHGNYFGNWKRVDECREGKRQSCLLYFRTRSKFPPRLLKPFWDHSRWVVPMTEKLRAVRSFLQNIPLKGSRTEMSSCSQNL